MTSTVFQQSYLQSPYDEQNYFQMIVVYHNPTVQVQHLFFSKKKQITFVFISYSIKTNKSHQEYRIDSLYY